MKRVWRIFFGAVFLIALAACTAAVRHANEERSPSYTSVFDRVNQSETTDIRIDALENSPALKIYSTTTPGEHDELAIFVSPSCNYCGNMVLDVMESIVAGEQLLKPVDVLFIMIPRQPTEARIIAGLMCVGRDQFPIAAIYYYEEVRKENGRGEIYAVTVENAYARTLDAFNVSDTDRQACEQNPTFEQAIAGYTLVATEARTKNEVPVVIYNDTYYPIDTFDKLREIVR